MDECGEDPVPAMQCTAQVSWLSTRSDAAGFVQFTSLECKGLIHCSQHRIGKGRLVLEVVFREERARLGIC
jgi:hypothetical protein